MRYAGCLLQTGGEGGVLVRLASRACPSGGGGAWTLVVRGLDGPLKLPKNTPKKYFHPTSISSMFRLHNHFIEVS